LHDHYARQRHSSGSRQQQQLVGGAEWRNLGQKPPKGKEDKATKRIAGLGEEGEKPKESEWNGR
jgi:hypothetical protein